MKCRTHVVLVATFLFAARLDAQIVNGSFETPPEAPGSNELFNTGSSFSGWTVVGASNVALISGLFTQNGISFPAQSGAQWLDLTGNTNAVTGVRQTIATTPGTLYNLSFWVGNVSDPTGLFGTTSRVDLLVNGAPHISVTNGGGVGTSTQYWLQFVTSFVASGASTTLAFMNGDPPADNHNGLDNITISVSSVPEPASLTLFATGLVSVYGAARRRRKAASAT